MKIIFCWLVTCYRKWSQNHQRGVGGFLCLLGVHKQFWYHLGCFASKGPQQELSPHLLGYCATPPPPKKKWYCLTIGTSYGWRKIQAKLAKQDLGTSWKFFTKFLTSTPFFLLFISPPTSISRGGIFQCNDTCLFFMILFSSVSLDCKLVPVPIWPTELM